MANFEPKPLATKLVCDIVQTGPTLMQMENDLFPNDLTMQKGQRCVNRKLGAIKNSPVCLLYLQYYFLRAELIGSC